MNQAPVAIYGMKIGLCFDVILLYPIGLKGYKKGTIQNHWKMKVANYFRITV